MFTYSGTQQDGVEGFFRSSGKGLMSLLTKPTGGVINCVAMASDGIKRYLWLDSVITYPLLLILFCIIVITFGSIVNVGDRTNIYFI